MKTEMVPKEMMLRNPLCVRWDDADYKLVVDTAWERRMRVSELIRQTVLASLRPTTSQQVGLQVGGQITVTGKSGKNDM